MDPNATWRELADSVAQDGWPKAEELANDLRYWLECGGFPPRITGQQVFDRIVVKNTCDAILAWDVC